MTTILPYNSSVLSTWSRPTSSLARLSVAAAPRQACKPVKLSHCQCGYSYQNVDTVSWRATANEQQFILAARLSPPEPDPKMSSWEWRGSEVALLVPTRQACAADCFVLLSTPQNVMRGAFESAKVEAATVHLSIRPGGSSLWFEDGLKKESVCGGDVNSVMFETEQIEAWGCIGVLKQDG